MSICIYQTENVDDLTEIKPYLDKLREFENVEIEYFHQSAVAGELAGIAVDILLSKEVQIALSSIAVGQLLWQMLQALKKIGKKCLISANTAKLVALFKATEKIKADGEEAELEKFIVYGPMTAELDIDMSSLCELVDTQDDYLFSTYFLGVVFPKPRNRVKTIWYLFQDSGDILASWSTQTLSERMPDFLTPVSKYGKET